MTKRLFSLPVYPNDDKTRIGRTLYFVLIILGLLLTLAAALVVFVATYKAGGGIVVLVGISGTLVVVGVTEASGWFCAMAVRVMAAA